MFNMKISTKKTFDDKTLIRFVNSIYRRMSFSNIKRETLKYRMVNGKRDYYSGFVVKNEGEHEHIFPKYGKE